jgi:hypothetical protein
MDQPADQNALCTETAVKDVAARSHEVVQAQLAVRGGAGRGRIGSTSEEPHGAHESPMRTLVLAVVTLVF